MCRHQSITLSFSGGRTSDPLFCPPGADSVWVCPECAAKVNWKELT